MNRDALLSLLGRAPVGKLMALLNDKGHETRIVGGAVRDCLLGLPVSEVDLATTLLPQQVLARAAEAGLHSVPVGLAHGTVLVMVDGVPFEITTLREDVATDGRHASVVFGRDFVKDALRRDFTVNALSVSHAGVLYDYVGGLHDLAGQRVRFIGAARARIKEDYLRILRFFRFSAKLSGGRLDAEGLKAVVEEKNGLAHLSLERVRMEFLRLLNAPFAAPVLAVMAECGIAMQILGGVAYLQRFDTFVKEGFDRQEPDAILRLAVYGVGVREDATRLVARLRLSKLEAVRLEEAGRVLEVLHALPHEIPSLRLRGLLFLHGRRALRDGLILFLCHMHRCPCAACAGRSRGAVLAALAQTPDLVMPVQGRDFRALGLEGGPEMGRALAAFKQAWMDADFPTDQATLTGLMKKILARARHERDT